MAKITTLKPLVPRSSGFTVRPPPKRADPELLTEQHKVFRLTVCRRANWRCQWVENGKRCERSAARGDRMHADHIVERADGGALYDPNNGQCLCTQHNTLKGVQARAARHGTMGG
ncbi:HNH endonuclease signature motif containing protein [Bradyrhizobium guangdongense]|uniref:HNH endonuclease signature motif containing protein n=1 Tax=Bradyrhizobium guangdongense TaxID=1325090 RepID=UPI001319D452|nr:HNH endonuclease signature motif containing protein [Bradyrhizobium guangdongense]